MARGTSLTPGEADELDRLTGKHTWDPYSLSSRERAHLHRLDDCFRRSPENTPAAKVETAELDRKLIAGESLTRRDKAILQQGLIIGSQSRVDRALASRPRVHMPDRRELAPAARPRERRSRSRSSSSSRGDPDEPEPPLGRHQQPRAAG
jgi:hypothetical protein